MRSDKLPPKHICRPLFVGSPPISTQVLSETANVASKRWHSRFRNPKAHYLTCGDVRVEIISLITIHIASISGSGTAFPGMTALLSPPRWKRAAIPFTLKICRTAK